MNGFEVLNVDQKPVDVGVILQILCNIANDVFNELGILVSSFGHKFLIGPFQDGIDLTRCGIFHHSHQVFDVRASFCIFG